LVVKVFSDKEIIFDGKEGKGHEWPQFMELYKTIYHQFASEKDPIYLIADFDVTDAHSPGQIDVAILMKKGIVLLEMKDYEGEIIGKPNTSPSDKGYPEPWQVIPPGEDVPVDMPNNVIRQCLRWRIKFSNKLTIIRESGKLQHLQMNSNQKYDPLILIQSWAYFPKNTTFNQEEIGSLWRSYRKWFKFTTCETIIDDLLHFDSQWELSHDDMEDIIEGMGLKEINISQNLENLNESILSKIIKTLGVAVVAIFLDRKKDLIKDAITDTIYREEKKI